MRKENDMKWLEVTMKKRELDPVASTIGNYYDIKLDPESEVEK